MIALPLLRDGRAAETELPLLGGPPTSAQVQRCTLGASRKGGRRVCVRFLKRLRWCKSLMDKSFKTSGFLSRILKAGLVTSPGGGGYTEPKPTHCPQHPTHRPGPGRPRVGPQMQGSSRAGLRLPPAGPGREGHLPPPLPTRQQSSPASACACLPPRAPTALSDLVASSQRPQLISSLLQKLRSHPLSPVRCSSAHAG